MNRTTNTPKERARHALATRNAVLSVTAAGREQLRSWRQTGMGPTPETRHVRARLLSRLGVAVRLGRTDEARDARAALRRFDALVRAALDAEGLTTRAAGTPGAEAGQSEAV